MRPIRYDYDTMGHLTALSSTRDGSVFDETRWGFNHATGIVTNKLHADDSVVAYDYTPAGQLAARTNANGTVSRFFYSPGGKLQEEDHPAGTDDVLYGYDDQGNLTVAESAQCRYDTFYDYSKLRRDWEHVVLGNVTNAVFRRYDASGRDAGYIALVDIGGANGATQDVCKAYDALGRLEAISATVNGASPIAVTNFYDGSRHVGSSIHAGNCVVLRQIVYAQNRDVIESVINSVVTNGVTNVVSRFDYAYDGAGRRTRRVDVAAGIVTNSFGYDTRSQLVTAQLGSVQYGYNLTPYGNRTRSWGQALVNYTPDILNQYDAVDGVEPVYDLDGNLLRIPGRMAMAYDAKNQMTFCSNAAYRVWNTYDHLGRRIGKTVSGEASYDSRYLYDGWNMIAEIFSSGTARHYLWGLDLYGTEQGAGGVGGLLGFTLGTTWFIPLYDANGNITGYVSSSVGQVTKQFEYDAFGNITYQNGGINIFRYRFSTKFQDTETGLYYYGRRFYDPVWGRWLNRDPIEEDGGLNLYAFCGNDGVNGVDALGEWTLKFKTGFTDTEMTEIKRIFSELPDVVSKAEARTRQWESALSALPDCCKVKCKMGEECAHILKILGRMKSKLNDTATLTIFPKNDPKNSGALMPPRFVGMSRNRLMLSTNPNGNLRTSKGADWESVFNTIFHELSHEAGLGNEKKWDPQRDLYFMFAQNFDYLSRAPDSYSMRGPYNHWWGNLERPLTPHYLLWKNAVDAISLEREEQ